MLKKYNAAYLAHKYNASIRNIDFLLTFEEWIQIWVESGHLHERGCKRGQYCMARFGDKGPYAVGNVKIILHKDNIAEKIYKDSQRIAIKNSNLRRVYKKFRLTEEQKKKISLALKGRVKSSDHIKNHSESLRGFKHSAETKTKMSLSRVGIQLSSETKTKLSKAALLREARKRLVREGTVQLKEGV